MNKQIRVQIQIARIERGYADVHLSPWVGWYDLGQGKRTYVTIEIQNDGRQKADPVSVAAKLEFRKPLPEGSDYKFAATDFKPPNRNFLLQVESTDTQEVIEKKKAAFFTTYLSHEVFPEEYSDYLAGKIRLYAWGKVIYNDYSEVESEYPFCVYLSTNEAKKNREQGARGLYSETQRMRSALDALSCHESSLANFICVSRSYLINTFKPFRACELCKLA